MSDKNKKYIFLATISSLVLPVVMMFLWFLAGFENADGTPNNAPYRTIRHLVTFLGLAFFFQLAVYSVLGAKQHSLAKPSLNHGALYSTVLSIPFSLFVFFLIVHTSPAHNPYLEALWVFTVTYAMLWTSYFTGALVQYRLIVRHNNLLNTDTGSVGAD